MKPAPVLVACAHGTRNPTGRRLIAELALAARRAAAGPGDDGGVRRRPAAHRGGRRGRAVAAGPAGRRGARCCCPAGTTCTSTSPARWPRTPGTVAARPLGPDPRLVEVLHDRLVAAGADPGRRRAPPSCWPRRAPATSGRWPTSRRPPRCCSARWAGPVTTGYGSAAQPTVPDAVAAARAAGAERVVVAAYLLAPGPLPRQAGRRRCRRRHRSPAARRPDRRRPARPLRRRRRPGCREPAPPAVRLRRDGHLGRPGQGSAGRTRTRLPATIPASARKPAATTNPRDQPCTTAATEAGEPSSPAARCGCARGADRRQDGEAERAADLLAGVEQRAGHARVLRRHARDGGAGERHEGHAHAEGKHAQGGQDHGA